MGLQRGPGADVVPRERAAAHDDIGGFLHDGVVDGNLFEAREVAGEGGGEGRVVGLGGPGADEGAELRAEAVEGLEDALRGPDEHAGVPGVFAGGEVGAGGFDIGFLDEATDAHEGDAPGGLPGLAGLDVAEAGAGEGGLDADGGQHVVFRAKAKALAEDVAEDGEVADDVVGGQHAENGLGVAVENPRGGGGDGGGGVAADGFAEHGGGVVRSEEFADGLDEGGVGGDEDVVRRDHAIEAVQRLHDEGFASGEGEELLGAALGAERPEAFAFAAGHDDRVGVGEGEVGHGGILSGKVQKTTGCIHSGRSPPV